MRERESNYDVLRAISMLAVVLLHVLAKNIYMDSTTSWSYYSAFIHAFCSLGVPSFIMLSGAFTLGNFCNQKPLSFYKKLCLNIFIPTLLSSLVYILYDALYLMKNNYGPIETLSKVGMNLLHGKPYYHLWYMYMILTLFLVTPILAYIRGKLSREGYLTAGFLLLILSVIVGSFYSSEFEWGINSVKYIGYYILGDVFHNYYRPKKQMGKSAAFIGLSMLFFIAIACVRSYEITYDIQVFPMSIYSGSCPLIMGGAIALFIGVGFLNIKSNPLIDKLSRYSFWIYLIHALVIEFFVMLLNKFVVESCHTVTQSLILMLILWVLTVCLSYILSCICMRGYNALLKKLNLK